MLTDMNVSPTAVKTTSRTRLDGTPITPTCEIPLKACGCLAGDDCDCLNLGEFGEFFDRPIYVARGSA